VSAACLDDKVISFDQSNRQRDKRLKDVLQDFDTHDDRHEKTNPRQKTKNKYEDDENDLCAMMDRFNK
jgi:hypothetical protein